MSVAETLSAVYTSFFRRPLFGDSTGDRDDRPFFMKSEPAPLARPRCRSLRGVRVLSTGSYVPDAVVDNNHLHQRLGFDSDWIVKRTGILERRHALPHQATSDLCLA